MLTIDPPPAAVIGSITAFMPSQQPTAFTSRIRRKSASGMSGMLGNFSTPPLLTSTSSAPKASVAVPTAVAQSASLVTSWCTYRQDCSPSPAATAAPRSSSTSPKTTRAPPDTQWRACGFPHPPAPPGGRGRDPVVEHVTEDDPRPLGHEVAHVRLAHPPGAPGDQGDLAVEPAHGPLPVPKPNACLGTSVTAFHPGNSPCSGATAGDGQLRPAWRRSRRRSGAAVRPPRGRR